MCLQAAALLHLAEKKRKEEKEKKEKKEKKNTWLHVHCLPDVTPMYFHSAFLPHLMLTVSGTGSQVAGLSLGGAAGARAPRSSDYHAGRDSPAPGVWGLGPSHAVLFPSLAPAVTGQESAPSPATPQVPVPAVTAVVGMSPAPSSAAANIPMSPTTAASWSMAEPELDVMDAIYRVGCAWCLHACN